jgi:phosphate transport system permease protein
MDLLARIVVSAGGIAIIASVLGILVFICYTVRPLLFGADADPRPPIPVVTASRAVAAGVDEHETFGFVVTASGWIEYFSLDPSVATPPAVSLKGGLNRQIRSGCLPLGRTDLALGTSDGFVLPLQLRFEISFDSSGERVVRKVSPALKEEDPIAIDPQGKPIVSLARQSAPAGTATAVVTEDGRLLYHILTEKKSLVKGTERSESRRDLTGSLPGPATAVVMDHRLENLYVGTKSGHLVRFDLAEVAEPRFVESQAAVTGAAVTAVGFLIGDQSVVVGDARGGVRVWFQVASDDGHHLKPIHVFAPHAAEVTSITASGRDKGFATADKSGAVALRHATSEQTLATLQGAPSPVTCAVLSPRANGLYAAHENGTVSRWAVDNPHPEVSFQTLFGPVWYEGYPGPEFSWQSTGGTDDFEPKLSLIPLLFGTCKGTLFALIIAVPLAILGALYTAQFMHPMLRSYVKPTVEVMAALPSVVLGFIAGLWLAPILERIVPAVALMFLVLPLSCLGAMTLYRRLPEKTRHLHGEKLELFFLIPALLFASWICLQLNGPVESLLFGGDFRQWVHTVLGIRFDQRNALVVGIAMGFAVIPIIFTISEDALSNVPRHLASGSLALGATRWQTAVRVVLPAALPGIFSAVMIGLGRAVGETMIVLMATGNTPTMDWWNPFTGFRTLSANIAVEIPEAPHGGTLYRTLFLGALLLFVATFIVNTAAELVRQRMRRRYAQL